MEREPEITNNKTGAPEYLLREVKILEPLPLSLEQLVLESKLIDPSIAQLRDNPENRGREDILNDISHRLLGLDLEGVLREANIRFKPHRSNGSSNPKLLINAATPESGTLEVEKDAVEKRGKAIDITGAIEARNIGSAKKTDIPLIMTQAGANILPSSEAEEFIDLSSDTIALTTQGYPIAVKDVYYGPQALLIRALQSEGMEDGAFAESPFGKVAEKIKSGYVVDLYNLDTEMQILLLWLGNKAGVEEIEISANSPEVATTLPDKTYYFPNVEAASNIEIQDNTKTMLENERALSPLHNETGSKLPFAPGYSVMFDNDLEVFSGRVKKALTLHRDRYGNTLTRAKAGTGTDGGNQLDLDISEGSNVEELNEAIAHMHEVGGDWVIESNFRYLAVPIKHQVGDNALEAEIALAPSSHIVDGEAADSLTLQLIQNGVWSGNIMVNREQWHNLVDAVEHDSFGNSISEQQRLSLHDAYDRIINETRNFANSINENDKYHEGLVRGGIDWGIAQLGGEFGDNIQVLAQDPNIRPNGGEQLRAIHDYSQDVYGQNAQAVTINLTPLVDFQQFSKSINEVAGSLELDPKRTRLIGVSNGWAQIGIIGTDLEDTFSTGMKIKQALMELDKPAIA